MPNDYLYETLNVLSDHGVIDKELPLFLDENINPKFPWRQYQREAFSRFLYCYTKEFPSKAHPQHYLFNMATGSGKTNVMGGLILLLYNQGYRNFLFFSTSNTIIDKTRENFLNIKSSKYLFNEEIFIDNKRINIKEVKNFEVTAQTDINVCFTTIHKLHSDLLTEKENSVSFSSFRKHKVVLIADEAHHFNRKTKSQAELFESWENTIERVFEQNDENLLLEFTATLDYALPAIADKYKNKVIYRYDLAEYRKDRFSKEITLVYSDFSIRERILQALILSQYKAEIAAKYKLNLKPVILFKAQQTIQQSNEIKESFHSLIENLKGEDVSLIRRSDVSIIATAFEYFDNNKISDRQLAERLRSDFDKAFCLSVNDDDEELMNRTLLNTLEDTGNKIRAIFAVNMLSEGWDVLNLYDIVRCHEKRDGKAGKPGKTTLSEAQLIGRGARYFPFVLPDNPERFKRKFDFDINHELRVIEELHYHSINDNRYISEIRTALIAQGLLDDTIVEKELNLKKSFKETTFYGEGLVYVNERLLRDYKHIKSFKDLGVSKRNYRHVIASGQGGTRSALGSQQSFVLSGGSNSVSLRIINFPRNVVESAIAHTPFFHFSSISKYFPNLISIQEFRTSKDYLGELEVTFEGDIARLNESNTDKFQAMLGLLREIESGIKNIITEYEGSSFKEKYVRDIFNDKLLRFSGDNAKNKIDPEIERFVSDKDWFAFKTMYGTTEERAFVKMLDAEIENLRHKYKGVYLLRNEGHFKIYQFSDGRPFQPDFVLFLNERGGALLTYQIFIEPKGNQLKEHDNWKKEFLIEIKQRYKDKVLTFGARSRYRLIGVPFYNNENENEFKKELYSALPSNE